MPERYSLKDLAGFLRDKAEDTDGYQVSMYPEDQDMMEECARIIESQPINMGHMDAICGALTSAATALTDGAQTREWDSLQTAMGDAWADIQRAQGYAMSLRRRLPEGDGFAGEDHASDGIVNEC